MSDKDSTENTTDKAVDGKPLEDQQVVTHHSVTIAGQRVAYTAKAGRMVMYDGAETSKPKVALFYTAYLREEVESRKNRPLIFMWNGGPGSSSIWLHMYSLAPRRIVFDNDPLFDTSSWEHAENEYSLLDVADLVFIDPPCTGYSRMAPGEDSDQFMGVEADAAVVGDFVLEFMNRELRGDSPIVLFGESYGTLRTPAVADYLQGLPGHYVDGVVLVSSLMDVAGATFGVGTTYGAVGMLPSYTATGVYHGLISGDLETRVAEAEEFALNDYSVALLKGSRLSESEEDRLAKRMAELTALPVDLVRGSHLRVTLWRYVKAVLRDQRRIVGRLDTRFTSIDTDIVGETFENDPSMAMVWGPATRVLNRYLREDLGWEPEPGLSYRTMTPFLKWKPRQTEQNGIWTPQLETATQLRASVNRAPNLKVLLQSGYYDLGTPYFPAELTFDHLQFQPEQRGNISRKRYESGHMIYLHEPSLAQMKADLVEFLGTLRTPPTS